MLTVVFKSIYKSVNFVMFLTIEPWNLFTCHVFPNFIKCCACSSWSRRKCNVCNSLPLMTTVRLVGLWRTAGVVWSLLAVIVVTCIVCVSYLKHGVGFVRCCSGMSSLFRYSAIWRDSHIAVNITFFIKYRLMKCLSKIICGHDIRLFEIKSFSRH